MMKFTKTTLGEISIGKGQYGIGASAVDYSEELYTYLRISDINDDGTLSMSDLKSVDDEKAEQYVLKPNDIVFARTGNSTGRNYFYDGTDGTFVYAGFLIKFSIDPNKVNPKYIKYYCLSDEYKGWVQGHSTGSTRGNINAQTYAGMEIILPPREQQDKLVSILEDLELKRKNNEAINRNLQEQCFTIFHGMFDEIMSTSDLMEFGNIASFKYGTMPKKDKISDSGYVVFSGYKSVGYYPEKMFDEPQLIIVARGVGGTGDVKYTPADCYLTNLAIAIMVENKVYEEYIYHYLMCQDMKILNTGSAQPQITVSSLEKYKICVPNEMLAKEFSDIVIPIRDQIRRNRFENDKLEKIRDCLLPKLMLGEIDVLDLEI